MNLLSIVRNIRKINLIKTIYFNFHYFPIKIAIHMPFFIYWRSRLRKMNGRVEIDAPIKMGMVRFGKLGLGIQDPLYPRTTWEVRGTLVIKGEVNIGRGSRISIGERGVLTIGNAFSITGNSVIICDKEVIFGSYCFLSWDILIMDTDSHSIYNEDGTIINNPQSILFGNHVWIGCRTTILKGVSIADNSIISATSTLTRDINESNCIVGGHGKNCQIIKRNVNWRK